MFVPFRPAILSIVPYWNWNAVYGGYGQEHAGFQSYHTGIETKTDRFGKVSKEAFNRTILELKLTCTWRRVWFEHHFQSYHTGIETWCNWGIGACASDLSIVPYWNWNWCSMHLAPPDHLLSIVPYWNWNHQCRAGRWLAEVFQSYHTGIETGGNVE